MTREHRYFVYIMSSFTKAIYIGVTSRLYGRVWDHKTKRSHGHTSKHNETWLIYYEEFQYINNAIAREKELKGWRREKKLALIAELNPDWVDLADDWFEADDVSAARLGNQRRDSSFVRTTKTPPPCPAWPASNVSHIPRPTSHIPHPTSRSRNWPVWTIPIWHFPSRFPLLSFVMAG